MGDDSSDDPFDEPSSVELSEVDTLEGDVRATFEERTSIAFKVLAAETFPEEHKKFFAESPLIEEIAESFAETSNATKI